jgi:hypothetical protein
MTLIDPRQRILRDLGRELQHVVFLECYKVGIVKLMLVSQAKLFPELFLGVIL